MTPAPRPKRRPIVLDCRNDRRPHASAYWVTATSGDLTLILLVTASEHTDAVLETHRVIGHEYTITEIREGNPSLLDA